MASAGQRLIVFTDTTRIDARTMLERFSALAERAEPGRVLFTLRDYTLPVRERWSLGERLADLTHRNEQLLGIAERADLARAWGCSAFHLPQSGLDARDARAYLGERVWLSSGAHELDVAPATELDGILLSPIFEARKGRPALGVHALKRVSRERSSQAWFALGGVDAGNAAACLASGAAGVAVIGAALAADPEPLLGALGILRG